MSVTIKDIAKMTGLGIATISKYLNGGNVLPENRILIEKSIKELNFSINEFARGLRTNKSNIVGVIVPQLNNRFFTNIISAIEDILIKKRYAVIVIDCSSNAELEADAINFMITKKVDCIVNFPVCNSGHNLTSALERNIPVVLVDRLISNLQNKVDSVIIDNAEISRQATRLLIQNGHKNIGIIVGPKDVYTSQERLKGYCDVMEENGIQVRQDYIVYSDYSMEDSIIRTKKILQDHSEITALYVTNHEMTLGALLAIVESGHKIPDDISFIGFDSMDWANIVKPKLTIVEQPMELIGKRVAEIILQRLSQENSKKEIVTLPASLSIGESVKQV